MDRIAALLIAAIPASLACSRADASLSPERHAHAAASAQDDAAVEVDPACARLARPAASIGDVRVSGFDRGTLRRVPVRSQSTRHISSGWRLETVSERGPAAIVHVDLPEGSCYIGEGLFAGWPQERLRAAYDQLSAPPVPSIADYLYLD